MKAWRLVALISNEIAGTVSPGDGATRQSAHTDEALREISTPEH